MDLKWYAHADARDVLALLLDVYDEVYVGDPDPFHSREREKRDEANPSDDSPVYAVMVRTLRTGRP
ncbi:hypothetical protein [Streptomyces sp. NPDC056921]|uniref:hypothetical protein n=1 Tax=Streptomyces sp. NPDC056921 TaxID=3345966 RepID=UPI003641DDE3